MRPTPWHDLGHALTSRAWPTAALWLLLLASLVLAVRAWRRRPDQRGARPLAFALARIVVGGLWWQQSLRQIPPGYGALRSRLQEMAAHAAIPLQSRLVATLLLPRIGLFGPLLYAAVVAIGASLMLGYHARLGALAGLLVAIALWLGLYGAPGEWPWAYVLLILVHAMFVLDPPGRWLGADALSSRRW